MDNTVNNKFQLDSLSIQTHHPLEDLWGSPQFATGKPDVEITYESKKRNLETNY